MLDAIDERLKAQIGKSLTEVVASTGFVELVDGIGFSSDVLEFVLEMAVGSLTEAKAPEAYQSLVGSVLLREVSFPSLLYQFSADNDFSFCRRAF